MSDVSVFTITQATKATFTDLDIQYTLVVFIEVGSKKVVFPINGGLIDNAEDVTDLSHPWRSPEIAAYFSISESTMRRWLSKSGQGFAKIFHNTRLEHGLTLLQTTNIPISAITLNYSFNTPSHFSDSFKKRFGIKPSEIRKVEE